MTNRLSAENSPYLLQHAENPVDWYPWGEEALQKAKLENKPIFLSIGYAACHWCHVMAHESFEDKDTATYMNEHFVNIKVDREERPDLDSIYMSAVVAMTGQGGWPMSVFLTPEGQPFYAGTYFPPVRRYNIPSFREVLASVRSAWETKPDQIIHASQEISDHLRQSNILIKSTGDLKLDNLNQATLSMAQAYDWKFGGWGNAPKFPQPMAIDYLLRRAIIGDHLAKDLATNALYAMAKGGMYDVIGGGFARYSTDNEWKVPHFEKMLYDNAQLALAYLHGYLVTGDESFRQVCEQTLGFIQRELTHSQGGFYSSLDADSEGEEGKYYTWKVSEIRSALTDPLDIELCLAAYNVTEEGNFAGSNVLQRELSDAELSEHFHLPTVEIQARFKEIHKRLLSVRQLRIPPAVDDKVLTSWNSLALVAFSEAARYLGDRDCLYMAMRNAQFLLAELKTPDRLLRSWRNGQARQNAYLEDYAGLILALLSLYQTNPDLRWFTTAINLAEDMIANFEDPQDGFFDTRQDQKLLLLRPKDLQDNATPSGNSLAATALLQLASFTGRGDLRDKAEGMLRAIQDLAARYPTSFSNWLCAIDFALAPVQEVALIGDADHPLIKAFASVVWSEYRPNLVLACSGLPIPPGSPDLLEGRQMVNSLPTAYVCHHFECNLPVNDADELSSQLRI